MRIVVCSDEPYRVHDVIVDELESRGHEVVRVGSLADGGEHPWTTVAEEAATLVSTGECDEGVFLCWTGTGISMAANKVHGVRAALCPDPGTAAGARIWNHANVLCLSNRTLSQDMAVEILAAWLDTEPGHDGDEGVELLIGLDERQRAAPPQR